MAILEGIKISSTTHLDKDETSLELKIIVPHTLLNGESIESLAGHLREEVEWFFNVGESLDA